MTDLVSQCAAAACRRTLRRWLRTPAWPDTIGVCDAHAGELLRGDASTVLVRGDGSLLAGPWMADSAAPAGEAGA